MTGHPAKLLFLLNLSYLSALELYDIPENLKKKINFRFTTLRYTLTNDPWPSTKISTWQ